MKIDYDLTEPLKAYNYFLKDAYHEAASNFFDGLANDNEVDIEANRETNRQIDNLNKKINEVNKRINLQKLLRIFTIIGMIGFFIAAIVLIVVMVNNFRGWLIPIDLGLIAAGVGMIFLIRMFSKKIRLIAEELHKLQTKRDELINEARKQMRNRNC